MVNKQTCQMEILDDSVNDIRSNIVHWLSELYKKISSLGKAEQEHKFENYKLVFRGGVMSIEGSSDVIEVSGDRYSDVRLGKKIRSYSHIPVEWITNFCL
ncbi:MULTISPECIES: hypothetical protein [unclassified Paenibacillus]|uniref:Uncharacterized protein n=1 Tax=Paenibacillus provencensis TaxID=441151 RepID=A0ABW3Q0Y4_9BACL|nr:MULTISPECIES: hypothetical protein [unclassified Paenibacillus]SDX71621.1 hypothetical protein SAMN05518848_11295 [Paenibacillus sp. PDC88]SFS88836.1 hypothetical protein SAMN04488601_10691 [Paenibacillus sp. 453mf]